VQAFLFRQSTAVADDKCVCWQAAVLTQHCALGRRSWLMIVEIDAELRRDEHFVWACAMLLHEL
jgi:hypothetical protein